VKKMRYGAQSLHDIKGSADFDVFIPLKIEDMRRWF
jgi:predicted nucleotidyltransferase